MERTRGSQSEIGMIYQYAITAYLAGQLSANELVKDYIIYSSAKSARKFDDIVAKIQLKGIDAWFVSLIQVKHKESKKLNVSDVLKGKRIEYDLSEYINSFNEIIDDPKLACRQNIHSDNIRFCIFSNKSIQTPAFFRSECTFQFNLRRHSNIDPITKILLPFGERCWKFKCEDLLTSRYQSFLEGCYLCLEETNYSKINKRIQESCDIDNANGIINYIKDYFNNNFLHKQGLHKQVFEIELQKIRLSNFVPPLTNLIDLVDDDRVAAWNDITLNHHITMIAKTDDVDIEGCLYACLAQRINSLLKVNVHWNLILKERTDLNKDVVTKFIEYSKTKALRYWISPPNTLKFLILELWKLGDLPLVLKTDIELSYFEKYTHPERSYVVIGDMGERSDEISKSNLKIFSHLGNINSPGLRDTMLENTAISLQGRQETTLKDLLGCDVELLATLSAADVIGLMKKRIAYLKEDSLSEGNYLAFLIEDEKSPGGVNFTEPLVVGDNIVVECRRDDIKEWVKVIKESPSCLSYAIYHLRRADQRLELVEGERENLSHYFVDQFGDSVYTSKKNVPIPIIGEATPMTEINYVGRYLRRATISYDDFNSGSKAIVLLSGDVENIDSRIQFTEIKDICNVEQIIAEERKYFIDISGKDHYYYWNRLSAVGCPMFDVNVWDGKLEIKKFKYCSNLSSYISYEGKRFSEGEFFDEIGDNAVTVVTGEPGMGKSSLLKVLCNACDTRYVIFYDFIYFQHLLNRNKNLLVNPMECIFQEVHQRKPKRYSNLLRMLREKRKVILVLDSFDEIIPSCEKQSLAFIRSIADTGIQIVVGSRMKDCNLLMNKFNAKVVKLEPLSNFHDKECPVKWKFVANILANVPAEFTRNPLYLNFLQVISESGESLANITRFELYEKVVKMKIERRLQRIMISSYESAVEEFVTLFERLALVLMFGKEEIEDELKWECNTESFDCIKFGIVINFMEGYPVYDHFTFVEFLVAQWLVKAHQTRIYKSAARNIYKQLMNEENLYVLNILSEHLDIHRAILDKNSSRIRKAFEETPDSFQDVDRLGRNALHLATICSRPRYQIESSSVILNDILEFMQRAGFNINKRDVIMEWEWTNYVNVNVLDDALRCSLNFTVEIYLERERWKVIECERPPTIFPVEDFDEVLPPVILTSSIKVICNLLLLQYCVNEEFFKLYKTCLGLLPHAEAPRDIEIEVDLGLTSLHIACIYGSESVVQHLIELVNDLNKQDTFGLTPLHYNIMRYFSYSRSSEVGKEVSTNEAITRLLLEKGADVNIFSNFIGTPIAYASELQNTGVLRLLLEEGRNVNLQDALLEATEDQRINAVEWLLLHGANPHLKGVRGKIPFHVAVFHGEALVKVFLERGVNVNLQNVIGEAALHIAVRKKLVDIVTLLLQNGADMNLRNERGQTPFHIASRAANEHIFKLFMEKGASARLQDIDGETVLHNAAYGPDIDIYRLRFYNGVDSHIGMKLGDESSTLALSFKWTYIISSLKERGTGFFQNKLPPYAVAHIKNDNIGDLVLQNGADINLPNARGETALYSALYGRRTDTVELLLKNGADVNIQDNSGYSPLHVAAYMTSVSALKLLLDNKADVNIQDINGTTALHLAVRGIWVDKLRLVLAKDPAVVFLKDNETIVRLVLEACADIEVHDGDIEVALYHSVCRKCFDTIRLLLEHGADVNLQDRDGCTPLHVATHGKEEDIIRLLLINHANINLQNANGETALHKAVHIGVMGIIRVLIENGGDVNVQDKHGQSPLDIAVNNEDVAKLLLEGKET